MYEFVQSLYAKKEFVQSSNFYIKIQTFCFSRIQYIIFPSRLEDM
jgi:hypothetical protein